MLMPVGSASGVALEAADAGGCGFNCAPDRVCPAQTMAAIAKQQTKFLSVMTFPRFLGFFAGSFFNRPERDGCQVAIPKQQTNILSSGRRQLGLRRARHDGMTFGTPTKELIGNKSDQNQQRGYSVHRTLVC